MTIMLLPGDKILVLGGRMDGDTIKIIAQYMDDFLRSGVHRTGVMTDVSMVIDARVEPAISIEVPK